jgi:L-ribulose-5-phosphate 4-epimerase
VRLEQERRALAGALRRIAAGGLVLGAAGNISVRDPSSGLVAISPSGVPYEELAPGLVCVVDSSGQVLEGGRPSSELPMHLAILAARGSVHAIVHTHSPYATALGCAVDEIPVVAAEQPAFVGGATPVCAYAPTGTAAAGEAVLAAAGDRWAAVIRNHGPVCLGEDLERALACAFAVEETARIYYLARQLGGDPALLSPDEIERVRGLGN